MSAAYRCCCSYPSGPHTIACLNRNPLANPPSIAAANVADDSGPPNLDDESDEYLTAWVRRARQDAGDFSHRLFPQQPALEARDVTLRLAGYAERRVEAMRHRRAGSIAAAIRVEEACQRIYAGLPGWARW